MKTKLLVAALAAALAATGARADKVTLKSGSFLTGDVDVIRDGKLAFKSTDLGDVEIDVKNIAKIESDKKHVVQYLDGTKAAGKTLTVDDGVLMVDVDGEPTELAAAQVKATDPEEEKWHGSINLSGTVTRGNTVGESATIVGDARRRWEDDRFTADGGYWFAQSGDSKQDKEKTVSRFELQGQEDHFWSSAFYSYVNGKYEFDRIMNLKYRWRAGVGLGYQWLENRDLGCGKVSFNQELGMSYILEKYDHEDDDKYGAFRYAHHLAWEIAAVDGLDFVHNLEYLPQVDEWQDNYMLDMDFGVTYAFRANWQLIAKAEWDYKSKVGDDTKHSDLRYILGLGYKW